MTPLPAVFGYVIELIDVLGLRTPVTVASLLGLVYLAWLRAVVASR